MTVTSGFFNSSSGDRLYSGEQVSALLKGILADGIIPGVGGEFAVSATTGLVLSVASGRSWHKLTWTDNDAAITVTMDAAHPTLPRIDYVILEVDKSLGVRNNTIKKLTGTAAASPVPPTLIQTDEKQQYPLCQVAMAAAETNLVTGDLTDKRDTTDCPMAEILATNSSALQAQIDALDARADVLEDDVNAHLLPGLTNKSGGTLNEGALLIFDKANASAFTTTTLQGDRRIMGVLRDASVAADATGHVAMSGLHKVLVQGNVAIGQALIASTTAGRAKANGGAWQPGILGYAVTAYSGGGAGDVMAIITPDLGRAGASITVVSTQSGYNAAGAPTISTNLGSNVGEKLVLAFVKHSGTISTSTFNGNAMTALYSGASGTFSLYKYQTTATGSQNCILGGGGATQNGVVVIVLEGHNTSSANGTANYATATSTGPNVSCTDAQIGDLVVFCFSGGQSGDFSSWGSGQSEIFPFTLVGGAGTPAIAISKEDATGSTENSSAVLSTSRSWYAINVPIHLA